MCQHTDPGMTLKHRDLTHSGWVATSNPKFQLKNFGLQKESNQTEQRNSNCERNKIQLLIWTKVKFYSGKNLFKLVTQKEGFEMKL